jgi:predicted nuclease with RNAse H fold
MIVACGIHLMPVLDAIGTPRPSCIAGVDAGGVLGLLTCLDTDDELLAAVPAGTRVVAVDAPLVVDNPTGQRPVEHLLAWLDAPVFPNSIARLTRLHGGMRGVGLRDRLAAQSECVVETVPDLVLRELAWEVEHPPTDPPLELAEYRAAWLGVRPPRYRPKGRGRAMPGGRAAAAALLATAIELGGWLPTANPDDWQAIADAARLDAMACAYAAWRLAIQPQHMLLVGNPTIPLAVPADANLRARAELHGARLGGRG